MLAVVSLMGLVIGVWIFFYFYFNSDYTSYTDRVKHLSNRHIRTLAHSPLVSRSVLYLSGRMCFASSVGYQTAKTTLYRHVSAHINTLLITNVDITYQCLTELTLCVLSL